MIKNTDETDKAELLPLKVYPFHPKAPYIFREPQTSGVLEDYHKPLDKDGQ